MVSPHLSFSDSLVIRKMAANFWNFGLRVEARLHFESTLTIQLWFGLDFEVRESSFHIHALPTLVLSEEIEVVAMVPTLEFHLSRHWLCFRGTSRQHMPVLVNRPDPLNEQAFLWVGPLADFSVPPQQLVYFP
jgi:hypothetical protein